MSLIQRIKNYIPILFAILFILTCFILSILAFLGLSPFKTKTNDLGVLFMFLFLFGFYLGMCLGGFISFLLNIFIKDKQQDRCLKMLEQIPKKQNDINPKKQIQTTKYIDF